MNESRRALGLGPVAIGWFLTLGIDFFFNAGLFSGLFDQGREPGLLPDPILFRRIPIAYLALAVGVTALAWAFDRMDIRGASRGTTIGGLAGVVAAFLGVVGLWTAVEMTGLFVVSAGFVQIVELGAAGAFLGAYRDTTRERRLMRLVFTSSVLLALLGIVIQNLLGS